MNLTEAIELLVRLLIIGIGGGASSFLLIVSFAFGFRAYDRITAGRRA